MARLNGILSKLKGSVGSFTFKQNDGQTVVSEKIIKSTNSKAETLLKQRMKWTKVIQLYQVLVVNKKNAFGGTRKGRSDMTIKIRMLENGALFTKTLFLTDKHRTIMSLFDLSKDQF